MDKILEKIEKYILFITVFLLPITFLGISPNPFVIPKLTILTFGVALMLLIRALRVIANGKLDFSVGTFDFPVFLLAAAYTASAILRTPNKMEAFLLPGTATALIGGAFLYFLVNQLKDTDKKILGVILFGSGVFFSLFTLFAFSGILSKIPQLPAYIRTPGFTPEGGFLPGFIFLATVLPLGIGHFLSEKQKSTKALFGVAIAINVFCLAISIFNLLPGKPFSPRFPDMNTSWQISIDSLKESPIFGVGPGNYLTAFNRFRPLTYNTTDLWPVKFATASNFYLTLMTEVGLLGLAAVILLLVSIYKAIRKDLKELKLVNWGFAGIANIVSLGILIVILAAFPATILITVLLFIYLSLSTKVKHTSLNLTTQGPEGEVHIAGISNIATRFPALLITLPVVIAVFLLGYRASRILLAEYKFNTALNSLIKNDASGTYDNLREAIQINPYVDRYHATNARVNLALANAIAQKAAQAQQPTDTGTPAATVSDQDRQNITLLIQQSINEGKATVALNPLRSGNWEILAQIYKAIIPLAQGSDAFAVQTYRQAVALDPFNPNLRIALGGVFYSRKDYANAIRSFESAVAAKSDHANAHYNLAFALRDNKETDRAIQELSLVLSLLPDKTSQDYQVAKEALEDLQTKKKAEAPAGGEELTPPQGEQGPELKPPVELPEGSEPPQAPISPTPTPAAEDVSPSPILTPTPVP